MKYYAVKHYDEARHIMTCYDGFEFYVKPEIQKELDNLLFMNCMNEFASRCEELNRAARERAQKRAMKLCAWAIGKLYE